MKRFLKILAYIVIGLIVIVVAVVAYLYFKGVPSYPYEPTPEIESLKVELDSTRIERGAKIASLLCNECHKDKRTGRLTGMHMLDMPKEFGTIYSLNITQHPEKGIGSWTDGELYYFLRTGIRKDNSWAPPVMPKFPLMADEDVYSIIAWLRSNDPMLVADQREPLPNKYNLFMKFLSNVAFFPPPLPEQTITIPDSTDEVAFGQYVGDALCACYGCHSPNFAKMDFMVPKNTLGYYSGGNPMLNFEGEIVNSANITMDKQTGIGTWTKEQFRSATKYGMNPKGGPLHYPMFPHTTLSDTEVDAIWAYLQTVPPINNEVVRYQSNE
jgi:cytochrome c2